MNHAERVAALLERKANTVDVELPDAGITVTVRGLTRTEALKAQSDELDAREAEVMLIAIAMVDPKLTEDEVRAWQDASPAAEIERITDAVLGLSGMKATAVKETVQQFRG